MRIATLALLSVLTIGSVSAQRLSLDERRAKIILIIDEELDEVSRLAKTQDYKNPDTLLRMSELNLEKARHYREAENEKFLAIDPEKRRTVSKADYFKTSAVLFERANEVALRIVAKYKNYSSIGDVYFILANNYKELGDHKKARNYFSLAAKKTPRNDKVSAKSNLALADYYFNESEFAKAVPLYESSLGRTDEAWWTKDAFNLAWSYYRTRKYDKAINLMLQVHEKSGNGKYVNMRSQVERDIGIFYVDSNRIPDAIKFYESLGQNYTEQFVKIANNIASQGRFSQAESLLRQAEKFEKDPNRRMDILISQIDLFDKYAKIDEHLKVSQELTERHLKQPLNGDQFKKLQYHVNKKAAELQKAVASNLYSNVPKIRSLKSSQSVAYFELAGKLAPDLMAEKIFFQGETAYATEKFGPSINYYIKSFDIAKSKNDKKIMGQAVEGMLAALGQDIFVKNTKAASGYYVPVYTRYLETDKKSARSKTIYTNLFNAYFAQNKVPEAEALLKDFAENHPRDLKTQEAMLAKIMDHYRTKKDDNKIKTYIAAINAGEFKVSPKYASTLKALQTKMQIEGVQQSLEKGDKSVALKGYHSIYNSSESTPKAKANAAYNLSALYFEMGESDASYRWGTVAIKEMDASDVVKFSDSILTIATSLFLKQRIDLAADLNHRYLIKTCKNNSSNKGLSFKNGIFLALAEKQIDKALEIYDLYDSCQISAAILSDVGFELVKDLLEARRFETAEKVISDLEKNHKNYPQLIKPLDELKKVYLELGDTGQVSELNRKINQYYQEAKTKRLDIPVEAVDLIAMGMIPRIAAQKNQIESIRLAFPEATYNSLVKQKLSLLDKLTVEVTGIQQTGSGRGIVAAYRLAIDAYENFGNELMNFKPEGKGDEYVASFRKAMSTVYNPILMNAKKQRAEVKKLIETNQILSSDNSAVMWGTDPLQRQFISSRPVVIMDRGGKR
ncbi:MAG: tetratricopeptide repeat protein [Bacteriovoracaceae bacterium]